MSRMKILNAVGQKQFESPPVFNSVQRKQYFDFSSELLTLAHDFFEVGVEIRRLQSVGIADYKSCWNQKRQAECYREMCEITTNARPLGRRIVRRSKWIGASSQVLNIVADPVANRRHSLADCIAFRAFEDKKLTFAGRVGTGFSEKLLHDLYAELNKIRVGACLFFNLPSAGRSRTKVRSDCRRNEASSLPVKPSMVCQIKFTEWTRDDRLSHSVFFGIREVKRRTKWFGEKAS